MVTVFHMKPDSLFVNCQHPNWQKKWEQMAGCSLQCAGCCTVSLPAVLQVGNQCLCSRLWRRSKRFVSSELGSTHVQSNVLQSCLTFGFWRMKTIRLLLLLLLCDDCSVPGMPHSFLVWLTSAASQRWINQDKSHKCNAICCSQVVQQCCCYSFLFGLNITY